MKHTPGPWKIDDANPELVYTGYDVNKYGARQYICACPPDCSTDYDTTIQEEYEANAQRIVTCVNACEGINPEAVPELVEACKAVMTWWDKWGDDREITGVFPKLKRALARAKGQDNES